MVTTILGMVAQLAHTIAATTTTLGMATITIVQRNQKRRNLPHLHFTSATVWVIVPLPVNGAVMELFVSQVFKSAWSTEMRDQIYLICEKEETNILLIYLFFNPSEIKTSEILSFYFN